ncbi:hypothetical protein ACJMK2_028431 [Sinanodonta woodiana]|uniref:HECT domain-containing protein n=1 Tax=Sinanodonta woodiana TaxID=1069815 RepID=A0ABD3X922_SINWO
MSLSLTSDCSSESLVEILSKLESRVITSRKNVVNVHRDNVLDGGFRAFGRKSFDIWHELDVKFSGEDGIDSGGPQREFMRLALKAIKELPIFSGPDHAKMLVLDYKCLTECIYCKAGQMLAYFIMHRGPSPNFISHILYMALAEGIASIQPTPNEICDYELPVRNNLTLHFNQDRQTTLVKSLTSLWFKQWKEVLVFTIKPLDALQLDNMFDVKWSTEGSNRKCIEERILVYWRDFLQDLEGVCTTLGFNFPLQLSFIHPEDLQTKCCTAGFPYANTCTMELKIPVVNDYSTFQRNMAAAISMTVTFTNQ